MTTFYRTVFGKDGFVSNVVDIILVPHQIKNKNLEISKIKKSLLDLDAHYAYLQNEHKRIFDLERDIIVQKTLLEDFEIEVQACLASPILNKELAIKKSGEFCLPF